MIDTALISELKRPDAQQPLLYRFEASVDVKPVGLVPEGLRLIVTFDGRVTHGLLAGARVWGTDPLLLRRDGVGVIDAPKAISTGDITFHEHVRGYCTPPDGLALPPLEALLEPGFAWPDVLFTVHGFSMFSAAGPKLAALNRAIARIDGRASFARGRLAVETRLMEPLGSIAGPTATD
jgi:hypothetical protein